MMRENDFHVLLTAASFEATRFARNHVTNVLPFDFRCLVHLNQSCDQDPEPGTMLYPEDDGKVLDVNTERAVVELLCRDGRCPEWIDVSVHAVSPAGFTQSVCYVAADILPKGNGFATMSVASVHSVSKALIFRSAGREEGNSR